jgi:hypothetical protein
MIFVIPDQNVRYDLCTQHIFMLNSDAHKFHIPVMGLGFTIETPVKVAHYGINSVVSIIEDHLLERMRAIISAREELPFAPIPPEAEDHRAKRVTAYLEMLQLIVDRNLLKLKSESFVHGKDIKKYFSLLPSDSEARKLFGILDSLQGIELDHAENKLREQIKAGTIDVNIMTKVDRQNRHKDGTQLPHEQADAHAALRGFAESSLSSSIIFSAGLNPRLYNYCASFRDFFPDTQGHLKKKIILKVSDYRSAQVQGKFLAKKGLWVSEFRIESGLNCGGHAFATEGLLLGPILAEFREKRKELARDLAGFCNLGLALNGHPVFETAPPQRITVQGGIGTAEENEFLIRHYGLDGTGWGSPFLLVPEATSVDTPTLNALASAEPSDYYLSHASPLGIPFNNFRKSSSEIQRHNRIAKKRPGSPCYKKFLAFDTEFTTVPICTASREYQDLKIKQVEKAGGTRASIAAAIDSITEKDCLCEGLGAAAILASGEVPGHKLKATAICPGPNLAYFSGTFTLSQMVDHIYGRTNILNKVPRPHTFVNELELYVKYLKDELSKCKETMQEKQRNYLASFRHNLLNGLDYYEGLVPLIGSVKALREEMRLHLARIRRSLWEIKLQIPANALNA